MNRIAAVSMRVQENTSYPETRDAIAWDWITFLESFDLAPLLVPNKLSDPIGYLESFSADLVILTGGNSYDESTFHPRLEARNQTEIGLLKYAITSGIPVLGVCRGLHVINGYFGGQITHNFSDQMDLADGHVATCHPVLIVDPAWIDLEGGGDRIRVNSYHVDAVTPDQAGSELVISALSSDKELIEGLYHPTRPIAAIQWHPERQGSATRFDAALILDLLAKR